MEEMENMQCRQQMTREISPPQVTANLVFHFHAKEGGRLNSACGILEREKDTAQQSNRTSYRPFWFSCIFYTSCLLLRYGYILDNKMTHGEGGTQSIRGPETNESTGYSAQKADV